MNRTIPMCWIMMTTCRKCNNKIRENKNKLRIQIGKAYENHFCRSNFSHNRWLRWVVRPNFTIIYYSEKNVFYLWNMKFWKIRMAVGFLTAFLYSLLYNGKKDFLYHLLIFVIQSSEKKILIRIFKKIGFKSILILMLQNRQIDDFD